MFDLSKINSQAHWRLKTSLNILDTVLDTTEIASLTTDDVVLVYPK